MSAPLPSPPSLPPWLERRPTRRSECPPPDQQCPWVSCRHHLAFDLKKKRHYGPNTHTPQAPARLILSLPKHPADWPAEAQTCSLHVADDGAHTLDEVGALMGDISRERVRQLQQSALAKLAKLGIVIDIAGDMHLDTETRSPNYQRPDARRLGSRPTKPAPREASEPHLGMNPERMTAAMVRIQAEAREACPIRTISPADVDLAALESEIAAKRNPLYKPRPLVTLDTFSQRAEASRMRAGAATASTTRITSTSAKAPTTTQPRPPTTTQPRPPSPPSTASIEIPPQVLPALVQSDDQPEVAVVSALPVDPPPPPSPKVEPMPAPNPRGHWKAQRAYAVSRLKDELAERRITPNALAQTIAAAHPELRVTSAVGSVNKLLDGGGSPISVWFRRAAIALGLSLSDLCDDPVWLAAVTTEGAPAVANSQARSVAAAPYEPPVRHTATLALTSGAAPPTVTVDVTPLPTREDALVPLLAEALRQAQAADRRTAELTALTGILRAEIDDLQQQLAERTRERDAATATLADIKRRLA